MNSDSLPDESCKSEDKHKDKKPVKLAERVTISDIGYAQLLELYPKDSIQEAADRLDSGLASGKLKPSSSVFRRLKAFLEGMDERGEIYRTDTTAVSSHPSGANQFITVCPSCGGKLNAAGECHSCKTLWRKEQNEWKPYPMADENEIEERLQQIDSLLKRNRSAIHPRRKEAL